MHAADGTCVWARFDEWAPAGTSPPQLLAVSADRRQLSLSLDGNRIDIGARTLVHVSPARAVALTLDVSQDTEFDWDFCEVSSACQCSAFQCSAC